MDSQIRRVEEDLANCYIYVCKYPGLHRLVTPPQGTGWLNLHQLETATTPTELRHTDLLMIPARRLPLSRGSIWLGTAISNRIVPGMPAKSGRNTPPLDSGRVEREVDTLRLQDSGRASQDTS